MTTFTSKEAQILELRNLCIDYQTRLYNQWKEIDVPTGCSKYYNPTGLMNNTEHPSDLPLSLELFRQTTDSVPDTELPEISIKYNAVQKLRTLLEGGASADNKLKAFKIELNKVETTRPINTHRDSYFTLFIKNAFFILTSLVAGAGLLISYASKNSLAFWKSHGQILTETLKDVAEAEVLPVADASAP